MKKIVLNENNPTASQSAAISEISNETGVSNDFAKLLYFRGTDTVEKARRFLNPGRRYFSDPYLLKGMLALTERLIEAREKKERVLVYGDYDADGVCAVTVLMRALKSFGVEAYPLVPEREEGYGLNCELIKKFYECNNFEVLITVDCGVSNRAEIETVKTLGADVFVSDHHEIPPILPDCTVINPKLPDSQYPFTGLCGTGVAFKIACALLGEDAYALLDYVALATVADSMELVGENRDIVAEGLKIFNGGNLRPCFARLIDNGKEKKEITSQTLAYTAAPRINAAGRMGEVNTALALLLCDDNASACELSRKLTALNVLRQVECDALYRSAKEKIRQKGVGSAVIMLYDREWKTGFVGIVASKLVEEYSKPVILFAGLDGNLKGSARSTEDVNIYEAVLSVSDILIQFGGHAQAAGLSVKEKDFATMEKRINSFVSERSETGGSGTVYAERYISERVSLRFAKELCLLEPTGLGNRRPRYVTEVETAGAARLKPESQHVSFRTRAGDMLMFNGAGETEILNAPFRKDVVFEINLSAYRNREYVKGYVKELIYDENSAKDYLLLSGIRSLAERAKIYESAVKRESAATAECAESAHNADGNAEFSFLVNVSTDREIFKNIYSAVLPHAGAVYLSSVDFYYDCAVDAELTQFLFCMEVFGELGIIYAENEKLRFRGGVKRDLNESLIYREMERIKSRC